jgi:hypothetical protein
MRERNPDAIFVNGLGAGISFFGSTSFLTVTRTATGTAFLPERSFCPIFFFLAGFILLELRFQLI